MNMRIHSSGALAMSALTLGLLLNPCLAAGAEDLPTLGVKQGEMYPDFLLPDLDGNLGRLSDYRGKKILLFHFASW